LAKSCPKCQHCRNAALSARKIFFQFFSKLFAGKRLTAKTTENLAKTTENHDNKEGEEEKSQTSDDAEDKSQQAVSIILQL
jgi:hypothetical protein